LTETRNPVQPRKKDTNMVKIAPTKKQYEQQLAEAAIIFAGFLNYFEEPCCAEQQQVVDAAVNWLKDTKALVE